MPVPTGVITALAYITVAICWSGSWSVGKLAVGLVPPLELVAVRFALAGLIMLAIARATRAPLGLEHWRLFVVAGALGVCVNNALAFVGLTLAPASDGGLIAPTLNPVVTVLFATFIGERLTTTKVIGMTLASVGALVVIGAANGFDLSGPRLVGDLFYLAGAIAWSAYATISVITTRSASPLGATAMSTLAGAGFLLPLGLLEHGYADLPSWPLAAWLDLSFLVIFTTVIGFLLFAWALRRFGASRASLVSYLVPVFTLIQARVILGEQPPLLELVGGAIILVGVRIATWNSTRYAQVPLD